ncbi:hypothetical protein G6F57_023814 [Rhizopus arrhizus]|nr:hypothetical protein G6F57_023814 [Rhizopus arrhizus]
MAAPASPQMKFRHCMARPPKRAMCRSLFTWRTSAGVPPLTPPAGRVRMSSPVAPENSAMPVVALMLWKVSRSSFQP